MTEMQRQENSNSENRIDLFEICTGVWKRFREIWWLLALILPVFAAGFLLREKQQYHPRYEATASFIVTVGGNHYSSVSGYYNRVTLEQLSSTFPYILTSGILNQIVAKDLEMDSVPGTISASVLEETNLFQIRVVASNGQTAYDILQSVIRNYPSVAKYVIGDTTLKLIDESGVPAEPMTQPAYKRAAAKGLLVGFLFFMAILLVRVLLRKTVKSQEDLKKFLNVKYLVSIPKESVKRRSRREDIRVMLGQSAVSYPFREALNTLQIRLNRSMAEKQMKVIMVTSTLAGEGKTTLSCNLAYAMARKGYRVLLIDADFRNPSAAGVLGLPEQTFGAVDVMKGAAPAKNVICQYQDSSLWVLPGGKPVDKVARFYNNGRLAELIAAYRDSMDLILIDTPPCGVLSDAAFAADHADGILMVIRQDYARRDKILEGVELLSERKAALIGCIINEEETGSGSYGYGRYGYGRYGYGKYGYHSHYGYGAEKTEKNS